MKYLFDGLYAFEIILLIVGAFLLTITLTIIIYYIAREESVARGVMVSFLIALIFLILPMLQMDKLRNGFYDMEAYSEAILFKKNLNSKDRENNKVYEESLVELIFEFDKRPIKSADRLSKMSEAFLAIGNEKMAISYADIALKKNPNNYRAFNIKRIVNSRHSNIGEMIPD